MLLFEDVSLSVRCLWEPLDGADVLEDLIAEVRGLLSALEGVVGVATFDLGLSLLLPKPPITKLLLNLLKGDTLLVSVGSETFKEVGEATMEVDFGGCFGGLAGCSKIASTSLSSNESCSAAAAKLFSSASLFLTIPESTCLYLFNPVSTGLVLFKSADDDDCCCCFCSKPISIVLDLSFLVW